MAAARAEGGVLRDRLSGLQPVASGAVEVSNVAPALGIARVEVGAGTSR